jgi:glycerophosphoryl diester phosphodiesterase
MHRHGSGVFAWTVDDEAEMRRLVACDVNGIVTNRPAVLAGVVRELRPSGVA